MSTSEAKGSANAPPLSSSSCHLLRFHDRNLHKIEAAAVRAGGLGRGAGRYLSATRVARISGRSASEVSALNASLGALGGSLEEVGHLKDAAAACFELDAGQRLIEAFPQITENEEEGSDKEHRRLTESLPSSRGKDVAQALFRALCHPSHGHSKMLFSVTHLESEESSSSTGKMNPRASSHKKSKLDLEPGVTSSSVIAETLIFEEKRESRGLKAIVRSFPSPRPSSPSPPRPPLPPPSPTPSPRPPSPPSPRPPPPLPPFPPSPPPSPPAPPPINPLASTASGVLTSILPSPYPGLLLQGGDISIGAWIGTPSADKKSSMGMPWFRVDSPLVYLGLRNYSSIMRTVVWYNQLIAVMLPCRVSLNATSGQIDRVFYAQKSSTSSACDAGLVIEFTEDYTPYGGKAIPRRIQVLPSDPRVKSTSCGQMVNMSNGALASSLCASISEQMKKGTGGVPNDIDSGTALFLFDVMELGTPTNTALINIAFTFTLSSLMPQPYRVLALKGTPGKVYSTSGPTASSAVMRSLYNATIKGTSLGTSKGTVTGCSMFLSGTSYFYSPYDLASANKGLGIAVPNITELINQPYYVINQPKQLYGPPDKTLTDAFGMMTEASLNVQMMTQYGAGSGTTFGFVTGTDNKTLLSRATYTEGQLYKLLLKPQPDVLSWSWGGAVVPGRDPYNILTSLSKFAAMGITVLASSGNTGAYITTGKAPSCRDAIFPAYPAASPWVTAVGSVMLARITPNATKPSVVATLENAGSFSSGGGFGVLTSRVPSSQLMSWQKNVVEGYIASQSNLSSWPLNLKNNRDASSSFRCSSPSKNCTYGRGFPDVALLGHNLLTVVSGQPTFVDGTSAASPALAGLVAQINAAIRAAPGLENQTIGWMNPFLYWAAEKYPMAFRDVTIGANSQNGGKCSLGYQATVGWDAVSGLGVPNLGILQQAAVDYVTQQLQGDIPGYYYTYEDADGSGSGSTYDSRGGEYGDYDYDYSYKK